MEVTATTIAFVRTAGSATRERAAISLSIAAITAVRLGDGAEEFAALATMPERELWDALPTDREKLAFWINVYNAGIQRELRGVAETYRHRLRFFSKHGVEVAGRHLSFNAIEHGMLRRSMFAYSLGYASNPFPRQFERGLRIGRRDPRVHFALNCGAASCPPIAAYDPQVIDSQLDVATRSYLESETGYDAAKGVVTVRSASKEMLPGVEVMPHKSCYRKEQGWRGHDTSEPGRICGGSTRSLRSCGAEGEAADSRRVLRDDGDAPEGGDPATEP